MSKFQITSILADVAEQVFKQKDVNQAKQILVDKINQHNVKDKFKMLDDVNKINNITGVHRYVANSLLRYEGMGINKIR